MHGNSMRKIEKIWSYLQLRLDVGGCIVFNNFTLQELADWNYEDGVARLAQSLGEEWNATVLSNTPPGLVLIKRVAD
jgi:hypothetical protein